MELYSKLHGIRYYSWISVKSTIIALERVLNLGKVRLKIGFNSQMKFV